MVIMRDIGVLKSDLKRIACSKCEGTSYWCMSYNVEERIKELIEKHTVGTIPEPEV
jgi:hypothetical protein